MYPGDRAAASWLPSEGIAKLWRGFVTRQPLTLQRPMPGARASAAQPLQLELRGVSGQARNVDFFDQADVLAPDVAVSGETASATWDPTWGGVRGIAALALSDNGDVLRVSRPVHVVLEGKDGPMGTTQPPAERDAGAADSGKDDAGTARSAAAGSGGKPAPVAGMMASGGSSARAQRDAGADDDTPLSDNELDGGTHVWPDSSPVRGGCDCSIQPRAAEFNFTKLAAICLVFAVAAARRARRR